MTRKRHRKSINPFRVQLEVERPNWAAILGGVHKPIEVDLGFGRGEFLVRRALENPGRQFVGIEIRDYLVEKMGQRLLEEPRDNITIILANIKEHLPVLFDPGMLSCVYIHFPDPWTNRKRHHKRRMVDANLVATLYELLEPGGEVHLMTDKKEVGIEMLALFGDHGGFTNACGRGVFCPTSTTGIRTREEMYYIDRGDPIYRLKFVRERQPKE
jgi:tRNA (guanine-N7-)-methyltransferase